MNEVDKNITLPIFMKCERISARFFNDWAERISFWTQKFT